MAKKRKKTEETDKVDDLKQEILQGVWAVVFFATTIFLSLAAFNKAGIVGSYTYALLTKLAGIGYFLLPVTSFLLSVSFLKSLKKEFAFTQVIGAFILLFSGLGFINIIAPNKDAGGFIGNIISSPLMAMFGFYASLTFLVALIIISIIILFDIVLTLDSLFFWKNFMKKKDDEDDDMTLSPKEAEKLRLPLDEEKENDKKPTEEIKQKEQPREEKKKEEEFLVGTIPWNSVDYTPPPLSILEKDKGKPGVGDIKANANIIKRTLQNFGMQVEMDEISIGPSVTRYALKPAEGVKLSRIVALQNDLALALAAHPLRIEAPIPGKSLVGIEIPNTTKTLVGLGSLLSEEEYQTSTKPLLIALGKGVTGRSHFANLAKMPHLLIAGATGSGKSVTIHTILNSLLFRNSPESLKFIMIDPKRVELTLYNGIPHLLTPVVTDPKKAILALKWAIKEMDKRYDILEAESVRDVESYHKNILEPELENFKRKKKEGSEEVKLPNLMPYIVIVIDELADLMQTYPRELEAGVVRLAQMSRAVGIHLILSTQRPSVNVITGLIKANVPTRIALQVSSQIDSRTILDTGGAEKLLGAGDMLYLSGDMSKPVRLQSAFITEGEVKKVNAHLKEGYRDALPSEIDFVTTEQERNPIFDARLDEEGEDDLYEDARQVVVEAGKASTSYIQRKFRVGYARAARLIDMLEERGVIGPGDGAKPREVIGHNGGDKTSNEEIV